MSKACVFLNPDPGNPFCFGQLGSSFIPSGRQSLVTDQSAGRKLDGRQTELQIHWASSELRSFAQNRKHQVHSSNLFRFPHKSGWKILKLWFGMLLELSRSCLLVRSEQICVFAKLSVRRLRPLLQLQSRWQGDKEGVWVCPDKTNTFKVKLPQEHARVWNFLLVGRFATYHVCHCLQSTLTNYSDFHSTIYGFLSKAFDMLSNFELCRFIVLWHKFELVTASNAQSPRMSGGSLPKATSLSLGTDQRVQNLPGQTLVALVGGDNDTPQVFSSCCNSHLTVATAQMTPLLPLLKCIWQHCWQCSFWCRACRVQDTSHIFSSGSITRPWNSSAEWSIYRFLIVLRSPEGRLGNSKSNIFFLSWNPMGGMIHMRKKVILFFFQTVCCTGSLRKTGWTCLAARLDPTFFVFKGRAHRRALAEA